MSDSTQQWILKRPLTKASSLCKQLDISYRQLDYWASKGYIPCCKKASGTGYHRFFTEEQCIYLEEFVGLIKEGFPPIVAERKLR